MLGSKAADLSFRDRIDGAWPGADGTPFIIDPANPRHYVIQLFRRLERCGVPVIARVNGHALAGGLGLVCACDMAVSTDVAQFGVPESKLGLFPMMILSYMMRIIPRRKLYEIATTGESFSAAEALGCRTHAHLSSSRTRLELLPTKHAAYDPKKARYLCFELNWRDVVRI